MVDKITPNDPRIQNKTAVLNGETYSYLLAEPSSPSSSTKTIVLVHGWPDLAFGWRYQIPLLTSLGFRVIALNMMGYSKTAAPQPASFYTYKRASDDIAALCSQLSLSSIILGGHDWGGAVVYRVALWYPKLISAVFSICTPFTPPRKEFLDAAIVLPNFKYQQQLRGEEVEREIVGEEKIRQFLNAAYGGRTPSREPGFSTSVGVIFKNLPEIGPTSLLSKEEMDFYVQQFSINGMHGPLNWYRTGKLNFDDDKELLERYNGFDGFKFSMPFLFIAGKKDAALPPIMSQGMEKWFTELRRGEVDTSHWALWEKPADVNEHLGSWLKSVEEKGRANL